MGPTVNRKLDVAEINAALRRAAYRALHGTRTERSGRFLPTKKRRTLPASMRHDSSRRQA